MNLFYKKNLTPHKFYLLLAVAATLALVLPLQSKALTISPTIKEFSLDPGSALAGQILVINEENKTLQISTIVKNFVPARDDGAPKFIDSTSGLSAWISAKEKLFILLPGTKKIISYTINIPKNAPPGGHFAGILIKSKPAEAGEVAGNAVIENQIGSLILVRVSGDVIEDGRTNEFFLERDNLFAGKKKFSIRFENFGNTFLKPYGIIKIYNFFGKQIEGLSVNDEGGNVLPRSGRKFDVIWQTGLGEGNGRRIFFGKHKVALSLVYGSNNKEERSEINFWLINKEGALIALAIVVILMLFVFLAVISIRKKRFFVEKIKK